MKNTRERSPHPLLHFFAGSAAGVVGLLVGQIYKFFIIIIKL